MNKKDVELPDAYTIQNLKTHDATEVVCLYQTFSNNIKTDERIRELISQFPSVGVWENDSLIAFCYTNRFSPDILEIANIFVEQDHQNAKIGAVMLSAIHTQAFENGFRATIVSTSKLYETISKKKSPANFYRKMRYIIALDTENTQVYVRQLDDNL